jgi:hypothetical protein
MNRKALLAVMLFIASALVLGGSVSGAHASVPCSDCGGGPPPASPSITLTPSQGPEGTTVSLQGHFQLLNTGVTAFTFNGVTPATQTCTAKSTDLLTGTLSCTFVVPNDPPGSYTVSMTVGTGATAETATATFTLIPVISLTPSQGNSGAPVTVSGTNFSPSTSIGSFTFGGTTPTVQTCTSKTTSVSGSFTCTFTVPSDSANSYTVVASGSDVGSVPADTASAAFLITTASSAPTTITVACSPSSIDWNGGKTTCTATVTGQFTAHTPTGTVTFSGLPGDASSSSCTLAGSSNVATCGVTYTAASGDEGSYSVTASFSPATSDNHNLASGPSSPSPFTVTTTTTVGIGCVPSSFDYTSTTTCTGTVTAADTGDSRTPSGVVEFIFFGSIVDGSCTLSGSSNSASCGVTYSAGSGYEGGYSIAALYFGDTYNLQSGPSTSTTVYVTTGTTTAITSCPDGITGVQEPCTVTVQSSDGSDPTVPSGTISFSGAPSGFPSDCTLSGSTAGTASCTFDWTPATGSQGGYTITAKYGGDDYHENSTSAGFSLHVTAGYSVTFDQSGIPSTGVTWGVTVGGTDHTGTGSSIMVSGLTGTVSYSYDSPVAGGTGTQYVCSTGCTGSVSGATTESATYIEQYQLTFDYTVVGGGSPSAPTVTYYSLGSADTCTAPCSPVYVDASSSYSYTNPLGGSGTTERWYAGYLATGTISGPGTISPAYYHQYYVQFAVYPSGYGTISPSTDAWYNSSSTVDVSATPNSPYSFQYWSTSCVGGGTACLPLGSSIYTTPNSVTVDGAGTVTANFLIPTSITYSGDAGGEYGDTVTLSATLTNELSGAPLAGMTITFDFGTQTVSATTDSSGVATTTAVLTQAAAVTTVTASFAGDNTYAGNSTTGTLTIVPEDTSVTYTGDSVLMTTSGSATFRGTVVVDDAANGGDADGFAGQITNAMVTFAIYNSGGTEVGSFDVPVTCTGSNPCVAGVGNSTYPGVGSALVTFTCTQTAGGVSCTDGATTLDLPEGSYDVRVSITAGNGYFSSGISDSTLTVYTPTGSFASGGGWVTDPAAVGGQHQGHFSFVVRFQQHGKSLKVQGQSMYIYRGYCDQAGYTTQLCDYIIKSNSWSGGGFAIYSVGGQQCVLMQSKASVQELLVSTGAQIYGAGNDQLTVTACAGTNSSSPVGTYTMTDLNSAGLVYHSTPDTSPADELQGGAVAVHKS